MTIKITNRELLRQYKSWKEKLIHGEVEEILIPQNKNYMIRISIEKKKTPFETFLDEVHKHPFKKIKRPSQDII